MPDPKPPQPDAEYEIPVQRLNEAQLARLLEVSSSIECECPNHLAQLVTSLLDFERYAAHCSSRNEKDRMVHAYLHQQTAKARDIMEQALVELARFEKIEV